MNKVLRTVDEIDQKIAQECAAFCMDDYEDRARMAWWVYQNFVTKHWVGGQDLPTGKKENGAGSGLK